MVADVRPSPQANSFRTRVARTLGAVVVVVLLGAGSVEILGLLARQDDTLRDAVAVPIHHVEVRSYAGRLRLERSTGSSTILERRVTHSLGHPRASFSVKGDLLVVQTGCPALHLGWCAVDLLVAVPDGADVRASAGEDGIQAKDVDGPMRLRSEGSITVTGGRGRLELDSSDGHVTLEASASSQVTARSAFVPPARDDGGGSGDDGDVRLDFAAPPLAVTATSRSGQVVVEVPFDPMGYRVDARSVGGHPVDVRTGPPGERSIRAEADGRVTVGLRLPG